MEKTQHETQTEEPCSTTVIALAWVSGLIAVVGIYLAITKFGLTWGAVIGIFGAAIAICVAVPAMMLLVTGKGE